MTEIIQFFQFDENECRRRVADVELEYELTKPDRTVRFSRYKEFFSEYFPLGTNFERLPGLHEAFYVEYGPDAAIAKIVENVSAGFGAVSGFLPIHNVEDGHYTRWWQEKPAKQIKADKAMLAELVKQRYLSDLEAQNKAEEARQIEMLVAQAERVRIAEEEARIQAIREQARADLLAVYNTPEAGKF